jgi:hypothetical protein
VLLRCHTHTYAVYELPFGRGKALASGANKAVNAVNGGWAISPIVTFRTGFPMPVQGVADNSGTFSRGPRANCNSIPAITGETPIAGTPVASSGSPTMVISPTRDSERLAIALPSSERFAGHITPMWT